MHNPTIKSTRQSKNDFIVLSNLLLAKDPLIITNFRENKMQSNKINKMGKEKLNGRFQQDNNELIALKVDGREINTVLNAELKSKKMRTNLPLKYIIQQSGGNTLQKLKKLPMSLHQQQKTSKTKSYPNIFLEDTPTNDDKIEEAENAHLLPQILSNKEIFPKHNHSSLKRGQYTKQLQKSIDKSVHHRFANSKRRETMQGKYQQEEGSNKMELKKIQNYLQYKQFLFTINLTNHLIIPPQEEILYKACICKGNNGLLVKSIMKTRPWWTFKTTNEIDSCNLVWTEWKRNKSINLLSSNDKKYQKMEYKQFNLAIKTVNKQIKERSERKFANFSKLIGKNTQVYVKYQDSILNENYLTFNSKSNHKTFQENSEKNMKELNLDILPKNPQRKLVNHIPGCLFLHSKKLLFLSMSKYYEKLQREVFEVLPLTFLITKGVNDPEFVRFTSYFQQLASKNKSAKQGSNIWICKPGENSNRGNGIEVVSSISQIRSLLSQKCGNGRTLIIQKYMQNPFLYNKRKFDIRCYILITCVNGLVKGYWYEQGYVRTTSKEYTLKNLQNKLIHLTNDAIQKKGEEYGKFQNFNKVSFAELERYVESTTEVKFRTIQERIKSIATDLIVSVARKLNPHHKEFTFEIFGLDFMLDDKLNPYLIEANSNPCLEVDGNVLGKVIPPMIENAIRVAIDPIFPPPCCEGRNRFNPGSTFQTNKMFLAYDSLYDAGEWGGSEQVEAAEKECEQFEGEVDEQ